jgi:hypothetical protein
MNIMADEEISLVASFLSSSAFDALLAMFVVESPFRFFA